MFDGEDFDGLPAVVLNPEGKIKGRSLPSVSSDSRQIAHIAMTELLDGNPASILFIEWFKPSMTWSSEKLSVCRDIAKMHGLKFAKTTPSPDDATNPASLERRISEALAKMPRPCGVFAVTDALGAAAVSAALKLGAEIPDDVLVASVDDDPEICENCSPTLSSVRPDFHKLGFTAASLLSEFLANPHLKPRKVNIPALGMIRRASSRHIRVYDRTVHAALEKIRLHACEGITPGDIAKEFDVTRRMAEIRFKAATGKTISDEILERRLSIACDYLQTGNSTIAAIANFCGWNSDIAFRKAFKSRFGISPRSWRTMQE